MNKMTSTMRRRLSLLYHSNGKPSRFQRIRTRMDTCRHRLGASRTVAGGERTSPLGNLLALRTFFRLFFLSIFLNSVGHAAAGPPAREQAAPVARDIAAVLGDCAAAPVDAKESDGSAPEPMLNKGKRIFINPTGDSLYMGQEANAGTADDEQKNDQGVANVGIGAGVLKNNVDGRAILAIGTEALASNLTGIANTAIGFQSMLHQTDHNDNAAVGYRTMRSAHGPDTYLNVAMGHDALSSTISGARNTALGALAMQRLGPGKQNVAVGLDAMRGNNSEYVRNSSSFDVAIGSHALQQIDAGNANVAVGLCALSSLRNGNKNIAIGFAAGHNLVNSSYDILIGNHTRASKGAPHYYLDIGNVISADLKHGMVGIGTAAPRATLDIDGALRLAVNASPPVACTGDTAGSVALTKQSRMCACDGIRWIFADRSKASCSWN